MYEDLTPEKIQEEMAVLFTKAVTFDRPMGRIGNTDWYRLADNVVCSKSGWEKFLKALEEQGHATTGKRKTNQGLSVEY